MDLLMNTLAKLQKNRFPCDVPGVFIPVFVLLFSLFSSSLIAQAPDPLFQSNWSPNTYKIMCKPPDACNLDQDTRNSVENMLTEAVKDIQNTSFKAPTWWAPKRVTDPGGQEYIELYESGNNNVAFVSCQSYATGGQIVRAIMNIGNRFSYFRDNNANYWNYNFVSHEIFHLSQYEYPFWDSGKCGNVPGWVMESTATAYATHMMRKRYPSVWPSRRNKEEARDMAGLRRYDQPLPVRIYNDSGEVTSGLPIYQRISSFWRHVAEVHHEGKYDFLAKYMMNYTSTGDWVGWLHKNSQEVTGVNLGMVFGGFLADFAGWGDRGYPGEIFGRKQWLQEAFDGCDSIYLNKEEPVDYVEVDLKPMAGDCIEVVVAAMGPNGIDEGESAAIQIAAMIMAGPPSSRGGVHLGLAASNSKKNFHCAREVKKSRKKGLAKCLFVPDDGKIRLGGGPVDARLWNVIAQEKSDPKEMRQETDTGTRAGELKNLYTVAYTPTQISMRDTRYSNKDPITVRFYFILDVAELKFNGQKPPSSGASKKRTVGSFILANNDPQTTVPKQDTSGRLVNSYSLPEQFRPSIPMPAHPLAGTWLNGKLLSFHVGWGLWEGDNSAADISSVAMFPAIETGNGKYEGHPLSVGETGSFPGSISGSMSEEGLIGTSMGTLMVDEFTDLVFRASFNGTLCRQTEWRPDKEYCPNPIPVSGKIIKAFAGSRLPGNSMIIERTPGTEMYRKAAERSLSEWSTSTSESAPPASDTSTTGTSSGTGGAFGECACTCEERDATNRQGEDLKARREAGEDVAVGDIMGLMRCSSTCQREYMICIMEENKKEEALEAKHQSTKPDDCDCSCTALNGLQSRTTELLQALQSGSPSAMDEMQKMGQCMSVCQNELTSCAQR